LKGKGARLATGRMRSDSILVLPCLQGDSP
jgi:hypothetical protein